MPVVACVSFTTGTDVFMMYDHKQAYVGTSSKHFASMKKINLESTLTLERVFWKSTLKKLQ